MVHTAYDSVELVNRAPARVDALACYGPKILAGCSDSSLRIFAPQSPPDDDGNRISRDSYTLDRTVNSFWRRAPLAIEVSESRDLLLSLSEWIASHRLPNLETVAAIPKTKGANVFIWDDRRGMMCVARQKRLTIYRLDGGREFVEVKDFGVLDVVRSMAWCGENICLGIRKEYMIINSITGVLSEVFPSGRSAPPLVIPLPSGELLLGKDNIGVFVDENGKLLQDGRVCWSEAPGSIIIHKPYAIARLSRYIEIRSLRAPYPLVQTIVLRDAHILVQSNNCVIAAVGNSIHGLLPVPLGAQIVQLTASGNFEEALALCKLLPPEDTSLRIAKESSIHMRYGHYLFDNGSYEEALEQFFASQVDITYVLSMYPSIIFPKTSAVLEHEKSIDFGDELFLRASPDASDDIESSYRLQNIESDDKHALEMRKMNHNSLAALVKYLQKKRLGIIDKAVAEVTEEVVLDVVHSTDFRRPKGASKNRGPSRISSVAREIAAVLDTALLQSLILTEQSSTALDLLKGPNYCDLKICEDFLQQRSNHIVLLELYKYNEMHRDALGLLIKLVEDSNLQPNTEAAQTFTPISVIEYLKPICSKDPMLVLEFSMHVLESCPTQTIELFLAGNIPGDLVNSYLKQHAPNMQSRYLELMLSMNNSGASSNLQNELVQIYLSEVIDWYQHLRNQEKWDEKLHSSTRKKLLSALDGISGRNAEILLNRLPLDALYEERALLLGRMNQHQLALSLYVNKLHWPELAMAYCDHVYDSGLQQPVSRLSTNVYHTLLQIYLNPGKATKDFEHRSIAVMPSMNSVHQKGGAPKAKGGRSSKKVVEIEGAEEVRISQSSTDSGRSDGDVDEILTGTDPIMMDEALNLLSKRWDRMNGAQALKLLPRSTKLQCLLPFLGPLLRKSSEGWRNYSIIKNLRYSENMQVKGELYKYQQNGFRIDSDSTCSLCRKKIGSSVFVIYPNRKTLVHFVCFRDSQKLRL